MTHDELLAKILETGATALQSSTLGGDWIYDAKTNALRAVVERHRESAEHKDITEELR